MHETKRDEGDVGDRGGSMEIAWVIERCNGSDCVGSGAVIAE